MNARRDGKGGSTGFTLVELIIVVAIASILTMQAAPSFTQLIESQRAKNAATDLVVALTRARSEALRLNRSVTLAPKSGGSSWAEGWQIADPLHAGGILEDHDALSKLTVSGPVSVIYKSSGRVQGATILTVSGTFPASTRYVCVDLSGRPTINTTGSC